MSIACSEATIVQGNFYEHLKKLFMNIYHIVLRIYIIFSNISMNILLYMLLKVLFQRFD